VFTVFRQPYHKQMPTKSHTERRKRFETSRELIYRLTSIIQYEPIDYDKTELSGRLSYTRGIYSNMYRGRLWTMRQYAGYATPKSPMPLQVSARAGTTGLQSPLTCPLRLALIQTIHSLVGSRQSRCSNPTHWKTCCACLMAFRSIACRLQ